MTARRRKLPTGAYLDHTTKVDVRFAEVDSLEVVWHGHYVTYFEDARVAFGRTYGISYESIREAGMLAPVVHLECDYLKPARYGDRLDVVARLHQHSSAKLDFTYRVIRCADGELLTTGRSIQVFMDFEGELILSMPKMLRAFYAQWAQQMRTVNE